MSKPLCARQARVASSSLPADSVMLLSGEALVFLQQLHRRFNERRLGLLRQREVFQAKLDSQSSSLSFFKYTEWIRQADWKGPSIPSDLLDRRVEITGPVDRKMIINGLNSGANVYMADFEDSTAPTFANLMDEIGRASCRERV